MRVNPEAVLEQLSMIFPDFAIQWAQDDNLATKPDGTFTFCGLFLEFTQYVRESFSEANEHQRLALFSLIEQCVSNSNDDLDTAACTCFLENIAGEGELSATVRRYLGPHSKAFFDQWN